MSLTKALCLLGALGTACGRALGGDLGPRTPVNCSIPYAQYASEPHEPLSSGKYKLGYMRPPKECRTFVSDQVDKKIESLRNVIKDPDLFRLFENSYPNTLDTTVKWLGEADGSDEELTFIITGDM